ncbi:tyrosine--tRNA ligase [bacterium (Candidatus Gribaldobacteria) CG_4_10_14_0_8_um_filter_33_9]|uniref:Tyrosine--tRNA ligase n=1 Tax=bacterium (Candidatus Gribaldobacteria) CG_4_10_14_0_8_um_filter_33_9 TaxID=2014266 RepID=A0A2M7RNB9_9BACT|nr:MAG: tyrosine--tRNA ligase [bacterium (Candidatus Gribaldobacteria) CG_4_10_14_0_8_um_filter_33_9]
MKVNQKIEEILTRSVAEILPTKDSFRKALKLGRRLRIYIGTDATGTSLHIGHATNYMILEKLRRLGHEIIFLIGDFTAQIGDPTDKNESTRKQLTREQVMLNTKTWIDQIKPVIDVDNKDNPIKILYNNDWLSTLSFEDVINLASNFTVQQMIERDMFQARIQSKKPLYLHEMFYPLMQGYDSVVMDVDVEMCGMDQKFNALAGRTLLKKLKNKEKFIFITTLLENPITGKKMMSKSMGTGVFLDFDADKMYGSLMAQPDENMRQLFIDCTWLDLNEIDKILKIENPRDAKAKLAREIVAIYHGVKAALKAEQEFEKVFKEKKLPSKIPLIKIVAKNFNILDLLVKTKLVPSKAEAKRLILQRAIKIDGEVQENWQKKIKIKSGMIMQTGKRKFIKF